jgi:HK97 gp10 family phage protein
MGVAIDGDKELKRQLAKIAVDVASALPLAALKGVEVLKVSAQQKAPVLTGALRDSIVADVEESNREIVVEVGPTVEYAEKVEFGGIRRAAKPYLRPALDETEELIIDALIEELNKVVEDS